MAGFLKTLQSVEDRSLSEFLQKQNTWPFNRFASIYTVLNAIIQRSSRANLSRTPPRRLLILAARLQSAGSLLLPKQLHANLQCEMSIRLLISQEESPLLHPKVEEVILSSTVSDLLPSFLVLHPDRSTTQKPLPSGRTASSSSFQPPFPRLAP